MQLKPISIGPLRLDVPVILAPMTGVTDLPFRKVVKRYGAGLTVSEMVASAAMIRETRQSLQKTEWDPSEEPVSLQLAGCSPHDMAEAAKLNEQRGAAIIDINMGCPVKKVCNSWCGSALLQDEAMVQTILEAVVRAVDVPVTLKFRTGWDRQHRNALRIAAIAQASGIAMLTLHGRTRADGYTGHAEYDTIAAVKASVAIPVVANGDIDSPEKAKAVLAATGADAVMVGRAAQGRPWIFREIDHFLRTGEYLPAPLVTEVAALMEEHLLAHYAFYGAYLGVRTARKHIGWYVRSLPGGEAFRQAMNLLEDCDAQLAAVRRFFDAQHAYGERLQYGLDDARLAA